MLNLKKATLGGQHCYLLEYKREIDKGNIVAGQEMITQLGNLVEDLENPSYSYDTTDADHRMGFIQKFCKHTKSPFYGKPFILELWQKALIEAYYSFKWTDEGYRNYYEEKPTQSGLRRFIKLILLIARKNGKSSLCSALVFTELMLGSPGSEIVCASNDDGQARILFNEAGVMRGMFDPKGRRTHQNLVEIQNKKNGSKVFRLSDRTSNKEGRNIDGAVLDESHEMTENVIAKSLEQSQSVKDEPWLINITTEGFVNDGYLDNELKYARQVLAKDIEDPTLMSFLYTQDSENEIWQDEATWMKSNPSLGAIKKRRYIVNQMNKARVNKGDRMFVLTKDFNWKQAIGQAWLMPEEIENPAMFDLEMLRGSVGIGGIDLSETTDLTSARVMVMRPGSNIKYSVAKYFIPETKVEEGSKEDKQNYLDWARQGLVEICPGNAVDYSLITQWYISLVKQRGIKIFRIGLDKWHAKYLMQELEDSGFECERVGMDKRVLSNPMKIAEADLKAKFINYNQNPIDKWCLGNVGLTIDDRGLIYPVKIQDQANRRIDGAMTMIICYVMLQWYRSEYMQAIR